MDDNQSRRELVRAPEALGGAMSLALDHGAQPGRHQRLHVAHRRRQHRDRRRSRSTCGSTASTTRRSRSRRTAGSSSAATRRARATRTTRRCRPRTTRTRSWPRSGTTSCPRAAIVRYGTVGTSPNRTFIVDYEAFISPSPDSSADAHPVAGRDPRDVEHHQREVPHRPALGRRPDRDDRLPGRGRRERDRVSVGVEREDRSTTTARPRAGRWRRCRSAATRIVETKEPCDQGGANGATTSCCTSVCGVPGAGNDVPLVGGRLRRRGDVHGRGGRLSHRRLQSGATVCRSLGRSMRRGRELHGLGLPRVRAMRCARRASSAVRRPACATSPRAATGVTTTCPADGFQRRATVVCRSSAGVCDVAENCTGSGVACPGDAFAVELDRLPLVGRRVRRRRELHRARALPVPADGFVSSSTVCRSSAGVCDVAESCTGSSARLPCGSGRFDGTVCRSSAGVCDVAENVRRLDRDAVRPTRRPSSGTVCRSTRRRLRRRRERATARATRAPADAFASSSTVVPVERRRVRRGGELHGLRRGVSDRRLRAELGRVPQRARASATSAESCTGSGADCPADDVRAVERRVPVERRRMRRRGELHGLRRRLSVRLETGERRGLPRQRGGVRRDRSRATASSDDCPADAFVVVGDRAAGRAAGPCDVAESCTGTSVDCPANDFEPSTTVCRGAADVCDVAENCTGSGCHVSGRQRRRARSSCAAAQPACATRPRTATASAPRVRPTRFEPSSTVCRCLRRRLRRGRELHRLRCGVSGGQRGRRVRPLPRRRSTSATRDDFCDGVSTACPADAKQGTATVVPFGGGPCDVADNCDGIGDACPADAKQPSGTVCRSAAGACDLAGGLQRRRATSARPT